MNTDLRSTPVTALERKIVARLRCLDVVQQTQILHVAEAIRLGAHGVDQLAALRGTTLPQGVRGS